MWCHGVEPDTPSGNFPEDHTNFTETGRCLDLNQSNHVAVINSYLNDFYCTASVGSSCDAQGIAAGTGTVLNTGWGTYKIVNNFMEGAAETIEVGGGSGPNTGGTIDSPTDFEVRRNHMFKPTQWMPAAQPTSGWPVVKNLYEHKNGQRALVEGNILQNVWGGFSQVGAMVLMTPKSQANGTSNMCPYCVVTDITFRYNSGTQGAQAFQLASLPDGGSGAAFSTSCLHGKRRADDRQLLPRLRRQAGRRGPPAGRPRRNPGAARRTGRRRLARVYSRPPSRRGVAQR